MNEAGTSGTITRVLVLLAALLGAAAPPLWASEWRLSIERVQQGELTLVDVAARLQTRGLDWQLQQGQARLQLAGSPQGALGFSVAPTASGLAGSLQWRAGHGLVVAGDWTLDAAGALAASFERGRIRVAGTLDELAIEVAQLPLAGWRRWLGAQIGFTPPRLEGQVDADLRWAEGRLAGRAGLRGAGFDTDDGMRAAAGVALDARLELLPELRLDVVADAGELLWDQVYFALPPSGLRASLQQQGEGWRLEASEPEVFRAGLLLGAAPARPWQATLTVSDLASWHARYLAAYLEARAWAAVAPVGSFDVQAEGSAATPRRVQASAELAAFGMAALGVEGIQLDALWTEAGAGHLRLATDQSWWGGLALGAWTLDLRQDGQRWLLAQPLVVALAQGNATLKTLQLSLAERPWSAEAALQLQDLDLASLLSALGWTPLPGRLSASFPGVQIEPQRLRLDGGAEVAAFGGEVALGAIEVERPLGPAPAVSGGFEFSGLDLAGVTAAFGFGEIQGELDGYVRELRLLSGKPVAFDAWLTTSAGYEGPKLISQRAVDNLSAVGGGPGGAMSRSFLRVFERFRYDAIGLGCRLDKGRCQMRGLESVDGGFLIVRGSGLPRITVMGHATRVNWSSLVARLLAATRSGGPSVE